MTPRRPLECPDCGTSWPAATARYCGHCGERLPARRSDRADATGRRSRALLVAGAVAGGAALAVATLAATNLDLGTPAAPDEDVALPEELGPPAELTPEQRDALERFDPDRVRCEPDGCEVQRLALDTRAELAAATAGWVAVLDGTVLRLRALTTDPTATGTSATEAATARSQPVAEISGGGGLPATNGTGYDLDLAERYDEVRAATGLPRRLVVADDGTVALLWPHRVVVFAPDGHERWVLEEPDRRLRFIDLIDDRVIVLRDDAGWPQGTVGVAPTTEPLIVTVHEGDDGAERWRRETIVPIDLVPAGLLAATADSGIELLDLEDGAARWRRQPVPRERVQVSSGPWLLMARPGGASLVDASTGDVVVETGTSALITGFQPVGDTWVAAWLDGSIRAPDRPAIVLRAMAPGAGEQWQVELEGLSASRCCPAVMPWIDGTLAVFDAAADGGSWVLLDAATGERVTLPDADRPRLPFSARDDQRVYATSRARGRVIQEADDRIGLVGLDGVVRVRGNSDLEVVSYDPLVVVQGREVLAVRPVPRADQSAAAAP